MDGVRAGSPLSPWRIIIGEKKMSASRHSTRGRGSQDTSYPGWDKRSARVGTRQFGRWGQVTRGLNVTEKGVELVPSPKEDIKGLCLGYCLNVEKDA